MVSHKISLVQIVSFAVGALSLTGCAAINNDRTILHGLHNEKHVSAIVKTLTEPVPPQAKSMSVWFIKPSASDLKLVAVQRPVTTKEGVESAVQELLRGPSNDESQSGLSSEIPRGTILLGVKQSGSNLELNLSKRFASGGEGTSMETRIEQLKRTINPIAGERKVFVDIEGQRLSADMEGLEIKQPIN